MMTYERFQALIEAYGANPARWPEGERSHALKFAEASPEAKRLIEEAVALDGMIDQASTTPVAPALQEKIMSSFAAKRAPMQRRGWFSGLLPGAPRWVPAAAFVLSLALGLGAGVFVPVLAGLDQTPADAALLALGGVDDTLFGEGGS